MIQPSPMMVGLPFDQPGRTRELGTEAAQRLAPYRERESVHVMRAVLGPNLVRYTQLSARWCRRIKQPAANGTPARPASSLLEPPTQLRTATTPTVTPPADDA